MRHLRHGRKLGRNATHRIALMRNLARALIAHGRITTTVEKAKSLRPFVEKLVTLTKKKNSLHARRLALSKLPDKETITKLFSDLGPRFADRPGGYTSHHQAAHPTPGDGARLRSSSSCGPAKPRSSRSRPAGPLASSFRNEASRTACTRSHGYREARRGTPPTEPTGEAKS